MKMLNSVAELQAKLGQVLIPDAIVAIYLYGSIVREKLRGDSDIDVAMLCSFEVGGIERIELISRLEAIFQTLRREMGLHQEVSILDLRGKYLSVELQYTVVTEGVLIYESDEDQRREFENAARREYFDFAPYLAFLRKRKSEQLLQKA